MVWTTSMNPLLSVYSYVSHCFFYTVCILLHQTLTDRTPLTCFSKSTSHQSVSRTCGSCQLTFICIRKTPWLSPRKDAGKHTTNYSTYILNCGYDHTGVNILTSEFTNALFSTHVYKKLFTCMMRHDTDTHIFFSLDFNVFLMFFLIE